ncbi:MAG: hypothetical protein RIS09_221, partial [Actinomycetota bacterium]
IIATTLVIGIADISFTVGDYTFNGIINATVVAIVGYQIMRRIAVMQGTAQ